MSLLVVSQLSLLGLLAQGQPSEPRMTKADYIEKFSDQAIREMHSSGVPASITLAQGILESDCGNSPLAKYANNHFGIKCHKGWEGPTFIQDDDEKNECFRKYYEAYESYKDHSDFLRTRERYAFLFDLKATDYKGWARGLKQAGYATNPSYADLLIRIIEENKLHQYDDISKLPESEVLAEVKKERKSPSVPKVLAVRQIEVSDNNIKYVYAEKGDTPEAVAKRNNMGVWQILKYNDLDKHGYITQGEIVYLQPKRNNAKVDFHTVVQGESLRDISQKYGVKIKRIAKMNGWETRHVPQPGDLVKLRQIGKVGASLTGR